MARGSSEPSMEIDEEGDESIASDLMNKLSLAKASKQN